MKMDDIKDIQIKIRKKYNSDEISPEILSGIIHILFEYLDVDWKNSLDNQPERSKREDTFIIRPENYPGPMAIDCKPSKECDEYHQNSKVQINIKSDAVL